MNEQVLKLAEQARVWLDSNNAPVGTCVRLDASDVETFSVHKMRENCVLVSTSKAMSADAPVFGYNVGVPTAMPFRFLHKVGSWKGGTFHVAGEKIAKTSKTRASGAAISGNIFGAQPEAQASVLPAAAAANTGVFSLSAAMSAAKSLKALEMAIAAAKSAGLTIVA